jgi:amidophosphoribosyltransferase
MGIPDDRPHDECGVVGVYTPNEQAAREAFFGTYALQHRGQESVGIASADGEQIRIHTAMGLLVQGFQESDLQRLTGHIAIGHTRYSTTGSSLIQNAQPMIAHGPGVEIAVGHNGNLVNAAELRDEMAGWGIDFHTSSDTEVLANIIANAPAGNWPDRIAYAMRRLRGAYSLVGLTRDFLLAVRDPLGVRPLCIGKLNGDGWVFASESCALDHIGADFVREVDPGEAIMVDESGFRTLYKRETNGRRASCVFEHIYFARPDSVLDDRLVYASRMSMGRQLAKEYPVDADMVIGVPDSATAAAAGYSQESGIPYGDGLVKNRYVGRTFILPDQRLRDLGVRTKLNPLPEMIRGKRLVVVEDSIVRGTTSLPVVNLLRRGGASEVHLRICAPPIVHPCQLGIDMPTRRELIASNKSVDEICAILGADSLGYLSHDGLVEAVGLAEDRICSACFTGNHPIPVQLEMDKLALEV